MSRRHPNLPQKELAANFLQKYQRPGGIRGGEVGLAPQYVSSPRLSAPSGSSVNIDPLQESSDSIECSSGPHSIERRTTEVQRTLRKRTKRA